MVVKQVRRQPVDATLVALVAVLVHPPLAHLARELQKLGAVALVLEQRHREAAGRHDRLDVEQDDLPIAGQLGEVGTKVLPFRVAGADDPPAAVEPQDEGLALEAAEHERQPPVLGDVGGRLVLAAGQVQVADAPVTQDAEGVEPFRREVDAALVGGRGVEEDPLRRDELAERLVQLGVELRHARAPRNRRKG